MQDNRIRDEYLKLRSNFKAAGEEKLVAMDALLKQAAVEIVLLDKLNAQALESGLVRVHPENATIQRALPVSAQITKHSAALTHIMDKLMKHLDVEQDEEDDLGDFA